MSRILGALVVAVLLIGVPVGRSVRRLCWRSRRALPWVTGAAAALLIGVALAVPHLDDVIPDRMRESPAGLYPFLAAAVGLGLIAIAAASAIAGAILSRRSRPDGPPA